MTGSASADTWLGSSAQSDLEIKNLESLEEEAPKAAKDNDDDLIENQHSINEMDSGDVLAYSGEISGEFKSTEAANKTLPAKEAAANKATNL